MAVSAYLIPSDFVVLLLVLVYLAYILFINPKPAHHRPPGPRQIPLLGNIHQISLEDQTVTYTEWAKRYGDVVYAKVFKRPLLILNSLRAAKDLMEKRGSKYSERPPFVLLEDIYDFKPFTGFLSTGEEWRRHRKWMQSALETKHVLDGYVPLQRTEVNKLLLDLIQTPDMFISHIKRFAGAMMLEIAYGRNVTTVEDEYIRMADEALIAILRGGFVSNVVDFFPILKHIPMWMPGGGFKRHGIVVKKLVRRMLDIPFEGVHSAMAKPSFLSSLIEETTSNGILKAADEFSIKGAASQLYLAGSDTSSSVLTTLVLAMTLYPDVFAKAQREIDQAIGGERLLDLQDRAQLPYLECILKELYRWHPPAPLGVPHRIMQDDQYRGYDIPGGSTVVSNIWAMSRDTSMFSDPEDFRPERFEDMDTETAKLTDPRHFVFGFGRRMCPGRHLADTNIWLAAANMLAVLDIRKARDAAGKEITPSASFTSSAISHAEHFPCDIRPRTQMAADLVAQSVMQNAA